jgi:hypothetical protein
VLGVTLLKFVILDQDKFHIVWLCDKQFSGGRSDQTTTVGYSWSYIYTENNRSDCKKQLKEGCCTFS